MKSFFHQLWMAPGLQPLQADLYSAHSKLILAPHTPPQAGSISAAPRAASRPTPALHQHSSLVAYCMLSRKQEKEAEKALQARLWGRWPSGMQTETRSAVSHHVQTRALMHWSCGFSLKRAIKLPDRPPNYSAVGVMTTTDTTPLPPPPTQWLSFQTPFHSDPLQPEWGCTFSSEKNGRTLRTSTKWTKETNAVIMRQITSVQSF